MLPGITMAVVDDPQPSLKRGRTRSPAYPYIALPNALEKAAVLWQVEGKHAAAVNVAMQHWGYKEDSSTGYSCVAALKKFGLVDHEGMGDTRQVRLSGLALTILLDKDPNSTERREALRAAALGPRIHAELWERYGTELPSDQSLKRYLVQERGFNEAAVDELLDEYKQTMTFAGMNVATGAAAPGLTASMGPGRDGAAGGTAPVTLAPATLAPGNGNGVAAGATTGRPESALAINALPIQEPEQRTREAPANALGGPSRPPNVRDGRPARNAPPPAPAPAQRQHDLFVEAGESDGDEPSGRGPLAPAPSARREPAPFSLARKELPVPLDHDLVARVPYPMSEEDFELLIGTLQLWKKRLVQPDL